LEDNYPLSTLADEGSFPFLVFAPKGTGDYEIWVSDTQVQTAMTVLAGKVTFTMPASPWLVSP
jgi:acyl-coenzyme A thioesterase PaaI-like protein